MARPWLERRFYSDRAVLYEPVLTRDPTTGRLTLVRYFARVFGLRCYFLIGERSSEAPTFLGAIEEDNLFTKDQIHVPGGTLVDSRWVIKNVTREPNGAPSRNFGRYWVVGGQPKSMGDWGSHLVFRRQLEAVQFQNPPEGVDPDGLDE